jgi:4-hydroxy-3-methylbut-2-enyl diphosphate reductase
VIHHFDYHAKAKKTTNDFLPQAKPVKIVLTSGASCPDTLVDRVMLRLVSFFDEAKPLEEVMRLY